MHSYELWDITKLIRERHFFVVLVASDQISICAFIQLEGICPETGLKYDLATQNEVGMHIKSQIEYETKPGYIL